MIILGKISQYTVSQIEKIKEVEGILYCEDYNMYRLFRDEGIKADMIFKENEGINLFVNNMGMEIKHKVLMPANTKINKNDPLLRNYEVYRARGEYYG